MKFEEFWNKWKPYNYPNLGYGTIPDEDLNDTLKKEMFDDFKKVIQKLLIDVTVHKIANDVMYLELNFDDEDIPGV